MTTSGLGALHKLCQITPWNNNGVVGFGMQAMEVLSDPVGAYGLDPMSTTIKQMNAVDPTFECVGCKDLHEGRFVMRWTLVVCGTYPGSSYDINLLHFIYMNVATSPVTISQKKT